MTCNIVAIAALLAFSSTAGAAEQPQREQLLVMKLRTEVGVSESVARLLNELILSELQQSGTFEVVGETDLQSMLEVEKQQQLTGCETDVSCLAQVAGALGAEHLVFGSVGALGDQFLLNLKLIDASQARVDARWSEAVTGGESALVDAAKRAVAALTQDERKKLGPEMLALSAQAVTLDGASTEAAATAPGQQVSSLEQTQPFYQKWWFWPAVGGAIVAGAATTYLLCCTDSSDGGPGNANANIGVTLPLPLVQR